METRLTTWDATLLLARKSGITVEQAKAILQAQAELAYEHCASGYPIPGVGTLRKLETQESKTVMPFGPQKGREVTIRAKRTLKFHISKAAKDGVFGSSGPAARHSG